MYVCVYAHVSAVALTGQKRVSGFFFFFLGLELWAGVSLLIWIAMNQAQVLCKAILSLNHRDVFPAQ